MPRNKPLSQYFILAILGFALLIHQSLQATTLFAILIGDTQSNLKYQSAADLEQMQDGVNFIAKALKLKSQSHVLKGLQANKNRVLTTLNNLPITHDDIVIFYFTGHGFNFAQKKTRWPTIHFNVDKQYLDLDQITAAIQRKKPRFGIILADCCNVSHAAFRKQPKKSAFYFESGDRRRLTCDLEKLFLKTRGILVVSASSQGEFSWASDEGGFLTIAFIDSFTAPTYEKTRTWDDIMQKVIYKTRGIQTPQYKLISTP